MLMISLIRLLDWKKLQELLNTVRCTRKFVFLIEKISLLKLLDWKKLQELLKLFDAPGNLFF